MSDTSTPVDVPEDVTPDWTPEGYTAPDYDETEPLDGREETKI